jgi:putative transposase
MSPFELVEAEKDAFPVVMICRAVGVSRSGYYAWRSSRPSARERDGERLLTEIRAVHAQHRERYGSPRIHAELSAQGRHVGRKRVARLMRENGLRGRPRSRFRRTTDSRHNQPVAPDLLERNFTATSPDQAWVGDITYIWTAEGWAYLAVLLDLFSRRVVGWRLGKSLDRELAIGALRKAIGCRRPKPGLIHHMRPSMSRAGDCWDNAVAESFFASLKKELVHSSAFATRTEAYDAIQDYIEHYYNTRRRHSTIGHVTPSHFEATSALRAAA